MFQLGGLTLEEVVVELPIRVRSDRHEALDSKCDLSIVVINFHTALIATEEFDDSLEEVGSDIADCLRRKFDLGMLATTTGILSRLVQLDALIARSWPQSCLLFLLDSLIDLLP